MRSKREKQQTYFSGCHHVAYALINLRYVFTENVWTSSMATTAVAPVTHIVCTPNICGGVPRINGTRLTVDWIVGQMLYAERTVEHMVEDYAHVHPMPAQVRAALA